MKLVVGSTWDGEVLGPDERATLSLRDGGEHLVIEVVAPWHRDPAPSARPGPTPLLWNHEVVELFLLGSDERYVEVELGPHGHHLVLVLHGQRKVVQSGLPLPYVCARSGTHWVGTARLPRALIPEGPHRVNAYAIHGEGAQRRYLACHPPGGEQPDFHKLDSFEPVQLP